MPSIYIEYLQALQRLRRGKTWIPGACLEIIDLSYKLGPKIMEAGAKRNKLQFLEGLMAYQELVTSGVHASLDHPKLDEQTEFVDEVELFVAEVIHDIVRQLKLSKVERDLANLFLENIWKTLQIIRPPP